ncbi:heme exporter protein CcmD [Stenotrophomonas sp. MMGLT7]|uniref:heme exporter protein CcmD n=1 Tax=Stenotrophomonas sp. MMGLT7 TaxID=2901227 RepID=UPI001E5D1F0E|nr:heme exporter protein CcmD [Stenotrophomonas sp. MMGLT7]MCD7097291.1 heme exporter protein CcmD [Stenotrophomonas sp. MMGLT7]
MSYLPYVIGAYAVFVAVLAWDFVSTRLQIRRALRAARQRGRRVRGRRPAPTDTELVR